MMDPSRLDIPARTAVLICLIAAVGLWAVFAPNPARAQDSQNTTIVIDGIDWTDQVYDEPPYGIPPEQYPNWRQAMRDIINVMSEHGKALDPDFAILVRGGHELAMIAKREADVSILQYPESLPLPAFPYGEDGPLKRRFMRNVDGFVINDLYCRDTEEAKPSAAFRDRLLTEGATLIALEVCDNAQDAVTAITDGAAEGVMVAAEMSGDPEFDDVPAMQPFMANPRTIRGLPAASNVHAVLNARRYGTRAEWVEAMKRLNHDVLIVDPFYRGDDPLSFEEVRQLKFKMLGAQRLVFARMTVGFADDTRFYWQDGWDVGFPPFLTGRLSAWDGLYWANYRDPQWQEILGDLFAGIMTLGFDGVMLDGIAVYLRDEALTPL